MELKASEGQYLSWLCDMINEREHRSYGDLCYWLYHQDYRPILPNDDNRCADGLSLREEYGIQLIQGCSMLEFLVALAKRMDYILFDEGYGSRIDVWFWLMIKNLGLQPVNRMNVETKNLANYAIIKCFIERCYSRTGKGGLFPLKHTRNDQRNVEVWYQMQEYIDQELL